MTTKILDNKANIIFQNSKYIKFRDSFELFIVYCFIGWVYEVIWCNIIENNNGFTNNGYLFGPWLPIYGIGMTIIVMLVRKTHSNTPLKIFLIGTITATIAELIGSYFMEFIMGKWLWDYSSDFLNFEGRIALRPDIYFGFLILIGIYFIRPKIKLWQEKYNTNIIRNTVTVIIMLLFITDLLLRFKYGSNLK